MIERLPTHLRLLGRATRREMAYVRTLLRQETVGGALLLGAALLAVLWANSPWHESYRTIGQTTPFTGDLARQWHLDLTLSAWAADGLLAVFFLVAGIELKREFVAGELRDPRKAVLPVAAAAAGVALPAILYAITVTVGGAGEALRGWAIPTATDIAFALAVLAVISSHLPDALRSFLLTLAVVDDLIAITIIAIFYSHDLKILNLLLVPLPLLVWVFFLRRGWKHPALLAGPVVVTWLLIHSAGVHATVAGVLLGLTVPVARHLEDDPDRSSLAEELEHRLRPASAGLCVPVFAFFAAGVRVVGDGFLDTLTDVITIAVVIGLVAGKAIGVMGGTWLVARFTKARLDEQVSWTDVVGLALLSGIGFTVSLLIGELAFGLDSGNESQAKLGVLTGSTLAAALAYLVLRRRNAYYRALADLDEIAERSQTAGPPSAAPSPPGDER